VNVRNIGVPRDSWAPWPAVWHRIGRDAAAIGSRTKRDPAAARGVWADLPPPRLVVIGTRDAYLKLHEAYLDINYKDDARDLCTDMRKAYPSDRDVLRECGSAPAPVATQ